MRANNNKTVSVETIVSNLGLLFVVILTSTAATSQHMMDKENKRSIMKAQEKEEDNYTSRDGPDTFLPGCG
jgi:hypothetical protein